MGRRLGSEDQSLLVWGWRGQVMDGSQDEVALICNYFGGREGDSGLSELEGSLNDLIKAIAVYSQRVVPKNANLGFLYEVATAKASLSCLCAKNMKVK